MWSLVIVTVVCAFKCTAYDQSVVVTTETAEQCAAARDALLKVPGYVPEWVICMPGQAPVKHP